MKSINLYYYEPAEWEKTRYKIKHNAGDIFGKYILEKLGFEYKLSTKPELITCGSILGSKEWSGTPIVWGSGLHNETDVCNIDINNIFAVRGKLTYNKLNTKKDIAIGDPGLLASYFYTPKTTKKYDFGIISHYVDETYIKENFADKNVILMSTDDIEGLLDKINECKFIFSSSLHGIIFAHSLGIPAIHVENQKLYSRDNFKFKDYYSVFDSIEYVKEDLKKINFDKYVNGKHSKYVPKKEEVEKIQSALLNKFPYGKIAICAVAKCENDYINDWVKWHIDRGVDEIHLFDNNDLDYEPIEKRIDKKYLNKVFITKIPGAQKFQLSTYDKFYKENKNRFDWIGFLDIDEYVVVKKWDNIKEFLNDDKFKNYNVIKLNWHMYGDDGKVERDMSVPVYKGIVKRLKGQEYESHCKQFVRGHNKYNVEICSNHYCTFDGRLPKQIMPDGKPTQAKISGARNCEEAYINHYMTKTLNEFIKQKLARGTDACFPNRKIDLEYFWRINKKTTKKLNYLKNYDNVSIEKIEDQKFDPCVGIISYLPSDRKTRNVRISRLNNLINTLDKTFNLPIIIIAQNWKDNEIKLTDNVKVIKYYDKLGITLARETLRQVFSDETEYSHIMCLDDDFEISDNPKLAQIYKYCIKSNPTSILIYENFLMNLAVFPRYVFESTQYDLDLDPEKGTGYEDWIYVSSLQKKFPKNYKKVKDFGLSVHKRSELINDEYSTWITKETNKSKLSVISRDIIYNTTRHKRDK